MKLPGYSWYNIDLIESKGRQGALLELLSDITGIRLDALTSSPQCIMHCSNGEKMSWIAGRKTTREEDIAYCLLGIFDINMPLLYGEGSNAFKRLQEEIIKQSTDHSLFAWQWPQDSGSMAGRRHPNLFAGSTKLFSNVNTKLLSSGYNFQEKLYVYKDEGEDEGEDENNNPMSTILSLTNFGLSINLELIPTADPGYVFGALNNVTDTFRNLTVLPDRELWCIPLQKVGKVYHRAPFPPGPFPVRTQRKQSVHPIHIPRDQVYFPGRHHYQYAFVILFPNLEIGAGFRIKSLGQIGDAVLSPHRSTVSIPRDVLQNRKIAASVLSIERSATCSFVLYVGTREVNN